MDLEAWALIATVAAGAASVVSLVAVAYQVRSVSRQTRELARQAEASAQAIHASTYLEIVKCQIEQDRFLADRPALRRHLYGRARGFGSQRRLQRAEATAEMFVDMVDLSIVLQANLPYDMVEFWRGYAQDVMQRSPQLRAYWQESRCWYNPEVQRFFDDVLGEAAARASHGPRRN